MTLHLAGLYSESNRFLAAAEDRIEALFAISVSEHVTALLLNDNTLSYEGEDFEKVMINIIAALNYASLGQWDEALVEARKVDHKLNLFNDRYEKKNIYKKDALAHYLSGVLYEAKGETNDAYIAYRKAYDAFLDYRKDYGTLTPPFIGSDLLRTAEALGLIEETESYRKKFPNTTWESRRKLSKKGELVFLTYVGKSPVKTDRFVDVPIPDGQGGLYPVRIAFPKFVSQPSLTRRVQVRAGESTATVVRSYLIEDVTAIAMKNLDDRIGRIWAKAIARATVKAAASLKIRHEAQKSGDPAVQILANISTGLFSLLSEQADKRSWRTLPDKILLARLSLPPGTHSITIRYESKNGGILEERRFSVSLKAKEKKFIIDRVP